MRFALAGSIALLACIVAALPTRAQESNSTNPPASTLQESPSLKAHEQGGTKEDHEVTTNVVPNVADSSSPTPPITLTVKADLGAQQVTVIEGDNIRHVWPISSGTSGFDTPTGTFQPKSANKMWYSRQYDWTPMPYAVFFTRGVAFHGTNATRRLGKSASHGCIRLATPHAEQLFGLVHKHGFAQTRIIVFGTAKQDAPTIVRRDRPAVVESASAEKRPYQDWTAPDYWNRP